jgi:hypothetical protein
MPRRLLTVEAKRLILTCFETFIGANGKQLTKMNIANKVNSNLCYFVVCTFWLVLYFDAVCLFIPYKTFF